MTDHYTIFTLEMEERYHFHIQLIYIPENMST